LCGIVGVVADGKLVKNIVPMLVDGLKRLEYRGYDSAGFAIVECGTGKLLTVKDRGRIDQVVARYRVLDMCGLSGLAHTRWATHGEPNEVNAHPHVDCSGEVAVVHNGIIRNFAGLRDMLRSRGHLFRSDTDTEVIAHLFEDFVRRGNAPFEAFRKTVMLLEGAYAIALIYAREPHRIYFARNVSPLIIGLGEGFNMVSSDIPSILPYTRRVITLSDGEYGYIEPYNVYIEREGRAVEWRRRITHVAWSIDAAEKGGYPHFMLKEIMEQPRVLRETYEGLLSSQELEDASRLLLNARNVFVTGAGTSFHAGLLFTIYMALLASSPVNAFISSEYEVYGRLAREGDVLIAVSQSGETIDTLKAVREFKKRGARVIALSNVVASTIPRESDSVIYTRAGPEIGVAATKTFLTQVIALTMLAARYALDVGAIGGSELKDIFDELGKAGKLAGESLRSSVRVVDALVEILHRKKNMYILSRGNGVPLAYESALKVKEVSYIHAEAYPAGESKHGPIALVEPGFPVIFILGSSDSSHVEKIQSNILEMKSRGALTITVEPEGLGGLEGVDISVPVADYSVYTAPYSTIPVMQLLAYKLAVALGHDPDKPRNLAKTVTVE